MSCSAAIYGRGRALGSGREEKPRGLGRIEEGDLKKKEEVTKKNVRTKKRGLDEEEGQQNKKKRRNSLENRRSKTIAVKDPFRVTAMGCKVGREGKDGQEGEAKRRGKTHVNKAESFVTCLCHQSLDCALGCRLWRHEEHA
jgi:hypothetical protein